MQAKLSLCLKLFALLLCAYVLFSPAAQATRQQLSPNQGKPDLQMASAKVNHVNLPNHEMVTRWAAPLANLRYSAELRIQEPSTMLFFGAGLVSVAVLARRRSKRLAK